MDDNKFRTELHHFFTKAQPRALASIIIDIVIIYFEYTMAIMTDTDKGDFKDKQFAETEVADKVVEQCKFSWNIFYNTHVLLLLT